MSAVRVTAVCRSVLAASLLLANGTGPALRHSHAGGKTAHTHEAHAKSHSDLEHEHPHAHAHVADLSDACSHVHFFWFGLQFKSLPLPLEGDDDSESGLPEPAVSPLGIGPVVGDLPRSERNGLVVATIDEGLVETRPISLHFADGFASMPAAAAFLCDTARHERSGTQLM